MASTPHRYHPNEEVGDDPDAILWDDCEACLENARKPMVHLDRTNKALLWALNAEVQAGEAKYRTRAEFIAGLYMEPYIRQNDFKS